MTDIDKKIKIVDKSIKAESQSIKILKKKKIELEETADMEAELVEKEFAKLKAEYEHKGLFEAKIRDVKHIKLQKQWKLIHLWAKQEAKQIESYEKDIDMVWDRSPPWCEPDQKLA